MTYNDTPAEECERDAREYEELRRSTDDLLNLEAELLTAYRTACVGLARRACTNPARPDSAYCEACAPAFDALCDGAPPAPATPSPITITATPNGMYRLRYNSTTIGVCSADALEALRLYLADGMIAAYDDAMERIAALEGALEEIAALEDAPSIADELMGITELFGQRAA